MTRRPARRLRAVASHISQEAAPCPTASAGGEKKGPLDGILIIDLGQAITGPLACTMMGDMGAHVIKVESPHGMGDLNRPIGPSRNGEGIYMHNMNRGKQCIALDTKLPAAQSVVKKLAAKADVLVQNFRPGAVDRMGLGYEDLKKVNPDLIYVSISGFGQTGPYSGRPAYDAVLRECPSCSVSSAQSWLFPTTCLIVFVAEPMVGLPVMQGEANGQGAPPQMINGYPIDKLTAWNTVQATLAALFAQATGKCGGQHVEVAMLDVGTNFMWPETMALTAEQFVDTEPDSYKGKASRRPPQSLMPTQDGHGVLMLWPEAPHFEKCLKAFFPELLDDARFADIPSKVRLAHLPTHACQDA